MIRISIRIATLAIALGAVALAAASEARAGAVVIQPDQLVPDVGASVVIQNPGALKGTGPFYKAIKLPVGKRVKRIVLSCSGAAAGFSFFAALFRKKVGDKRRYVVNFTPDSAVYDTEVVPVSSGPDDLVGPAARIATGYRYFVYYYSHHTSGTLYDIRVIYQ